MMGYVSLNPEMFGNPAVSRIGHEAFAYLVTMMCYAAQHRTKDRVPRKWVDNNRRAKRPARRLVDEGLVALNESGEWYEMLDLFGCRIVCGKQRIPERMRQATFEHDEFACVYCGSTEDLQADHIRPESAGGATDLSNLQTLCKPCNMSKGCKWPYERPVCLETGGEA